MLVYLDSAQFDSLERATNAERSEFFKDWEEGGAQLALSLHHLQEMGQVQDRESLSRRLKVLDGFQTIRCLPVSSDGVLRYEIRCLLAGRVPETQSAAVRSTFFPITDRLALQALTQTSQPLFHLMADALSTGAEAEALSKQARPKVPLKLPKSEIDWAAMYTDGRAEVVRLAEEGSPVHRMLLQMFDETFSMVRQHGSPRSALISLYGLSDVNIIKNVAEDEFSAAYVFYSTAREEAIAIARERGIDPVGLLRRADAINMYDCPGFRLKLKAQRGRKPHPKQPEPGDQVDEDHVMFAPYVDLLIVDKRTLDFVSQPAKNTFLKLPAEAYENIRRVANLGECRTLIRQFTKMQPTKPQ